MADDELNAFRERVIDSLNLTTVECQEIENVISIKDALSKYRIRKCRHLNMTVDEELAEVVCDDCGEKLNAVAMLLRFGKEQSYWAIEAKRLQELHAKLDAKVRCKCQHCGKMTRI